MTNKEWYYYDPDDTERSVKLTDKAPPEAVKSYEEYYAERIIIDEDGNEWILDCFFDSIII